MLDFLWAHWKSDFKRLFCDITNSLDAKPAPIFSRDERDVDIFKTLRPENI